MYPSGKPFMEQGIFGALIGAGLGAAGAAANRGAKKRQAQQQLDLAAKAAENQFQERQGGSFGERNAFKQRLLGNLASSIISKNVGGEPGSPGSFTLKRLDPQTLFANITAGQFGRDLRGATPEAINKKVDFTAPEVQMGSSFLGDLLQGAASGASMGGGFGGLFGGGGGAPAVPDTSNFQSIDPSSFGPIF